MTRSQRLLIVVGLSLALVAGLIAAGAAAGSLAVLATGGDYLLDAAAVEVKLRQEAPPGSSGRKARP